ncbi:MAG: hypothetical protein Q9222_003933, partial [Ikaeria aurantiellina]
MTVAHTLSTISYHLIANPPILQRLQDELAAALPKDGSVAKWNELEQLPYLTPVGMTSILTHNNPTLFPSPQRFDPDRWLHDDSPRLKKYLVPFSKGSRQCLGINLAYSELYLTLAAVFAPGRFTFELFETGVEDVEVRHDFFNACQRVG